MQQCADVSIINHGSPTKRHFVLLVGLLWLFVFQGFAQKKRPVKVAQKPKIDTIWAASKKVIIPEKQPYRVKIKVLSYNITSGTLDNGKTNLIELSDLIKKERPDLVALQELDSGATRSGKLNQIRILELLTGYETFFLKTTNLEEGIHGMAILTPHSFEIIHKKLLPSPENSDPCYMQSVLVEIATGRHVHFVNTWLDPYSPLNRGIQAAFINGTLKNSIYPVIVAGSFATSVGHPTLESLSKNWTHYPEEDINEVEVAPDERRTDYLWLLPNSFWKLSQYEVLQSPSTKKHQPILATFSWYR